MKESKKIKKKVVIEVEYANEWQHNAHHKILTLLLKTFEMQMFSPTDYTTFRNKDNKLSITGDVEYEEILKQ